MAHFGDIHFKISSLVHILLVFKAKIHIQKGKLTRLKFNPKNDMYISNC